MSEKYILDGYNVLHQIDDYRQRMQLDLESAREQLIRDLQTFISRRRIEISVVFDGSSELEKRFDQVNMDGVNVIFSLAPQKADPVIMDIIRKENRKRRLIIVTADGEIVRFAKDVGSRILMPHEFMQRIRSQTNQIDLENKFEGDMSPEELREWQKLFGVDDDSI